MKTNQSQKNIQKDWKQLSVGEVFTFVKSYAYSRDNLTNGLISKDTIGNIHYGDIHSTYNSPNIDVSKIEIPLIKDRNFNPDKDTLLKDGDLVMSDASEDYEGVGVTVSIHGVGNKKVVGGLHTFVLRDEKGLTNEYYRQYIFRNPEIRNTMQKIANGVSVYGISKTAVSKIKLPLPSLPEQNRIVSVLETWDKAIEKLSEKIEIKKQIKKGLMQDLLTGKKRLKGFSDKWETVEFNDFFEVLKKPEGYKTEEYLPYGEIPVIDQSKGVLISGYVNNKEKVYDFTKKPVIIFGDHSRVIKFIDMMVSFGNDGVKLFQTKNNFDVKFGYYVLLNFRIPETGYNRHFKYLDSAIFDIPKSKEEQKAIAKILTTADDEILELEKKLQIIKDQKKYLLNNLITGTIRTPETLSTKITK